MRTLTIFSIILAASSLFSSAAGTTASGPVIFYSDLTTGPNSGGQNNQGAFVTIYGKRFGRSQGGSTVTVGGQPVANYPIWTDSKITFQLGPNAQTGDMVVQIPGQGSSNGVPFTVGPGRIHFVAVGGKDRHSGNFDSPWRSLQQAEDSMRPGDITYAEDGVSEIRCTQYDGTLNLYNAGVPGRPLAIVAYPGATVSVGSLTCQRGIIVPAISQYDHLPPAPYSHWVIAGLHLQGKLEALQIESGSASDYRVVGNDITCPAGNGQTGCFATGNGNSYIKFLGNTVHDVGVIGTSSKYYHGAYFETDADDIEVGWNTIYNVNGCRGIQFFSTPVSVGRATTTGFAQYDLIVHDNIVHDTVCDGINLATVDAGKGPVLVFNNVIYNAGKGPDPLHALSDYACLYVGNGAKHPRMGGPVEIFNNTFYNCGYRNVLMGNNHGTAGAVSLGNKASGGSNTVVMTNNIVVELPGEQYLSQESDNSLLQGTHNNWFGVGGRPSQTSNNLGVDPAFANVANFDFHPLATSPMGSAGVALNLGAITSAITPDLATLAARDLDGVPRSTPDLGAYEVPRGQTPGPRAGERGSQ